MPSFAERLMATSPLQRAALGLCVVNVVVLAVFQFLVTPRSAAPMPLFLLFEAIWVFGYFMLIFAPRFGAAGTAAWGILAAGAAYRTHRSLDAENLTIILLSATTALVAIAFLVQRLRKRG